MWKGIGIIMAVAKIVIELHYDLDSHYGEDEPHSDYTPETVVDDLEDTVYEDLIDLMRGDRLRSWADYEIIENETID
jgi:hypothetical protein